MAQVEKGNYSVLRDVMAVVGVKGFRVRIHSSILQYQQPEP